MKSYIFFITLIRDFRRSSPTVKMVFLALLVAIIAFLYVFAQD